MHDRSSHGFTLVEILIVTAVIAVLCAIGIPSMIESRKNANETNASSTLRTIYTAQSLFRDRDPDGDGKHEFALDLPELSFYLDDRMTTLVTDPPLTTGASEASGYYFGLVRQASILPPVGPAHRFIAVALPASWGRSGARNFMIDETGVIRSSGDETYSASELSLAAWPAIGK